MQIPLLIYLWGFYDSSGYQDLDVNCLYWKINNTQDFYNGCVSLPAGGAVTYSTPRLRDGDCFLLL